MIRFFTTAAIAAALFAPVAGAAQIRVDDAAVQRVALAEEMSRQGHLMARQRADFGSAASLLRSAATVRGESEATVHDLLNAGHFNVYARRSMSAASAFNAAGELALELGDRATAARAFRFAAHAAHRVGDTRSAVRFQRRSDDLAGQAATVVAQLSAR